MTTAVRKRGRQTLTNLKVSRVDLVPDGANEWADIVFAKAREQTPDVVHKARGSVMCNNCKKPIGKGHTTCPNCGSTNLSKTRIDVIKSVTPVKKPPKNDAAPDNQSETYDDTARDDDQDEDDVQKSGWYDIDVRKDDIEDVDNKSREKMVEGEDNDDDIEALAEKTPDKATKRSGFKNTSSPAEDTTMMTMKNRSGSVTVMAKGKKLNFSVDHGDEGSQEVVENAEQMYRSESEPDTSSDDHMDNTLASVVHKAFGPGPTQLRAIKRGTKKKGIGKKQGLQALDLSTYKFYDQSGVTRNGTNTGHGAGNNKTTTRQRTAVPPPPNPNDPGASGGPVGKSLRIRKSLLRTDTAPIEALNLSTAFADNMCAVLKSGSAENYAVVMDDFVSTMNAAASVWFAGDTVAKANTAAVQRNRIVERVQNILKASTEAESSDDAAAGKDEDEVDSERPDNPAHKPTSTDAGDVTGMVNKGKEDIYKGLSPAAAKILAEAEQVIEKGKVDRWNDTAAQYADIPGTDVTALAKSLRSLHETDEANYNAVVTALDAAKAQLADSAVFTQIGKSGAGSRNADPMAKANEYADTMVLKSGVAKSRDELVMEYMLEHPGEFYQQSKV
jgi:hypothetical protein